MSGNVYHFPAGLHGLVSDLEFICEVAAGPKTPLREAITKEEEKHFVIWAMLRMVSLTQTITNAKVHVKNTSHQGSKHFSSKSRHTSGDLTAQSGMVN